MKILICSFKNAESPSIGSTHMYGVVDCLLKMGHNVVMMNRPRKKASANRNFRLSRWTMIKNSLQNCRLLKPIGGGLALLWLFLRSIHIFFITLAILVRRRGRFDIIYRRHTLFNLEYLLARIWRIPLVQEVNGLVIDDLIMMGWANGITRPIIDRLEKINMSKADKLITVTPKLKDTLIEYFQVPESKIVVIPNGTNTEIFRPMDVGVAKEKLNLDPNLHHICFIGAFHAWSGVENLIKSAPLILKEFPDARFLIVGNGALRKEMNKLAQRLGVADRMEFTGMVSYQNVPLYIGASDVCVCPIPENFRNIRVGGGSPLKLPEYMACARPVVIGNVVELSKDIVSSGSGLAVDMRNLEELAKALVTLLKDEELRKKMGERGRQAALEKYDWMKVTGQIVQVCQQLIKEKATRADE
jgi:glycosyltransferase involved in cell wall biosynthesis